MEDVSVLAELLDAAASARIVPNGFTLFLNKMAEFTKSVACVVWHEWKQKSETTQYYALAESALENAAPCEIYDLPLFSETARAI